MPRGSAPGERRGGRQKGTPNKATVEREAKRREIQDRVLSGVTPEQIAAMLPLDVMLFAMQVEAQAGDWRSAAALAKEAAPYVHAKKTTDKLPEEGNGRQGYIVAPEQATSMDAWAEEAAETLGKPGDV